MSNAPANGGASPPKGVSREALVAPRPRRFFSSAGVEASGDGFALTLDGRTARTPGKRRLLLPSRSLAEAIAAEWSAQGETILAETMPLTRLANTAIDGVTGTEPAVRDDILAFCGSDLLFYRAGAPAGLAEAQERAWNPVLAWARDTLDAAFLTAEGIIHIAQPQAALQAMSRVLEDLDAWQLTALHQLTTLTGSALLAIAYFKGMLSAEDAWRAAHVDEDWQISQWGEDAEAKARRALRWADMQAASRLLTLLQNDA